LVDENAVELPQIMKMPFRARLPFWAGLIVAALPGFALAQTVDLRLNPTSIAPNESSTLTVSVGNATEADLTAQLRVTLPPGLGLVPGSLAATCNATVSTEVAPPASSALVMVGSIPVAGCAMTAVVTASGSAQITRYTITVPSGALVTSQGVSNTVAASATLEVRAAIGDTPQVIGLTQAAATTQLVAAGFTVGTVTTEISTTNRAGIVIGAAAEGNVVDLVVSAGPGPVAGSPLINAAGLTAAQQSVAGGLQRTCTALADAAGTGDGDGDGNTGNNLTAAQQDLLNKCVAISASADGAAAPELQQVLDAISGREANAQLSAPMMFESGQIANISDRLQAVRNGRQQGISLANLDMGLSGAGQMAVAALKDLSGKLLGDGPLGGGAGDDPGGLLNDRLGLFLTGTLRRADHDTTDTAQGFDFRDTGLTAGVDYRFADSYVMGLAGGYGKSRSRFDAASGRVDTQHYSVSLYGSYFNDLFHLDVLGGYGHHDNDVARNISYDSTSLSAGCNGVSCSVLASGATSSRTLSFAVNSGLDYHREALAFGPTLEMEYKNVRVDGYTETSDSGLALTYGGISGDSLLAKAGVYANYAWNTRWAVILPQVRLRYMHEFRNDASSQMVSFAADTLAGAADRSFAVYTGAPDRSYFDWKASVLFQFAHGFAGFVDYGGVVGLNNMRWNELNVGLRIQTGVK
jgi:uncharacterized protein YhjY with autotransporter beta-barrel domain